MSSSVNSFGKVLLIRSALLIAIALCIVAVIVSEDRDVRAMAAALAIVMEIIRDAVLVSAWKR